MQALMAQVLNGGNWNAPEQKGLTQWNVNTEAAKNLRTIRQRFYDKLPCG